MPANQRTRPFEPHPAEADGTVTWIHLGDLHMTRAGEQNERDLGRIVDTINQVYSRGGVSFVFLPGDIADDGSAAAYEVVRSHLDRLALPWCGIVGDHDVVQKAFTNFETYIDPELISAFTVGRYRFLRCNAFAEPRPDSFVVDDAQLAWMEGELQTCAQQQMQAVLLLHCYPSDLKQGGEALTELLHRYPVLLVDMGHTHYNELSNDGRVIYSATRSTGQIEEGPVGFSVVTLDGSNVSWHFVEPDAPALVAVTAPADRRLQTSGAFQAREEATAVAVHAKVWDRGPLTRVQAKGNGQTFALHNAEGVFWSAELPAEALRGAETLRVEAVPAEGEAFGSTIRLQPADGETQQFRETDQENALGAWPERGILGTQLGPNKNGRKW